MSNSSPCILVFTPEEAKPEPVRLHLVQQTDQVLLEAVDAKGMRILGGSILHVTPKGIDLCSGVGSGIPLPRSSGGYIKISRDGREI